MNINVPRLWPGIPYDIRVFLLGSDMSPPSDGRLVVCCVESGPKVFSRICGTPTSCLRCGWCLICLLRRFVLLLMHPTHPTLEPFVLRRNLVLFPSLVSGAFPSRIMFPSGGAWVNCWGFRGPVLMLFLFYVNVSGMRPQFPYPPSR